jgi:anthranilate synthase component II
MLVMIDNYDSFTYNLVQYFMELGVDVKVFRNDAIDIETVQKLNPTHICISPGPCTPKEAGISVDVIRTFSAQNIPVPILGVCLGHQSIADAFGGEVIAAKSIMHGKVSTIQVKEFEGMQNNKTNMLFKNLPKQFKVTRYHSLAINAENLPDCLDVTACTEDDEIMAVQHKTLPVYGVQFHPEAILSEHGHAILKNFIIL